MAIYLGACRARVSDHSITVDYLADAAEGPLIRFATDTTGVTELRDLCARLAHDEYTATLRSAKLIGFSALQFRRGIHGALHWAAPSELIFDGDREQWETRSRLLDPLTGKTGFQFLDYDATGEIEIVVTTSPNGSF